MKRKIAKLRIADYRTVLGSYGIIIPCKYEKVSANFLSFY